MVVQFYKERNLKKIEIGAIDFEIPKDWDVRELKDVCVKITDGSHWSPKEVENSEYRIATVANLRGRCIDINSCKLISKDDFEKLLKEGDVPEKGDILFSKDGTVGICFSFNQNESNIALLSSIAILKPKKQILDSEFGAYILKARKIFWQIVGKKTGTALTRVVLKELKSIKLPLPPLPEQQKIAHILMTIDKAIEAVEEAIAKAERIKKALMLELLTKGIGHREFKDTEIGRIPKEWEVVRLGNRKYFEIIMGQSPPSSTYNKDGKGLPFLQGSAEFGSRHPKPQLYTVQPMKIANENDILISVRAPVGDINIAPSDLCIGRGLAAVKINQKEIDNFYIFYFLKFSKSKLEVIGGGSTFKGITKSLLEDFQIFLPPLPEQRKIAEILSNWDEVIETKKAKKEKLERMKKKVMDLLLTGKVRVKVEG